MPRRSIHPLFHPAYIFCSVTLSVPILSIPSNCPSIQCPLPLHLPSYGARPLSHSPDECPPFFFSLSLFFPLSVKLSLRLHSYLASFLPFFLSNNPLFHTTRLSTTSSFVFLLFLRLTRVKSVISLVFSHRWVNPPPQPCSPPSPASFTYCHPSRLNLLLHSII